MKLFLVFIIISLLLCINSQTNTIIAKSIESHCEKNLYKIVMDIEILNPMKNYVSFYLNAYSTKNILFKCMIDPSKSQIICITNLQQHKLHLKIDDNITLPYPFPEVPGIIWDYNSFLFLIFRRTLTLVEECGESVTRYNISKINPSNWGLITKVNKIYGGQCLLSDTKDNFYSFNMNLNIIGGNLKENLEDSQTEIIFMQNITMPFVIGPIKSYINSNFMYKSHEYYNLAYCYPTDNINSKNYLKEEGINFHCNIPLSDQYIFNGPLRIISFSDNIYCKISDEEEGDNINMTSIYFTTEKNPILITNNKEGEKEEEEEEDKEEEFDDEEEKKGNDKLEENIEKKDEDNENDNQENENDNDENENDNEENDNDNEENDNDENKNKKIDVNKNQNIEKANNPSNSSSSAQPTPPVQPTPSPSPVQPIPSPSPVQQTPSPTPVQQTPSPSPVKPTPSPSPVQQTPSPSPVRPTPSPSQIQPTPAPVKPNPSPSPVKPTLPSVQNFPSKSSSINPSKSSSKSNLRNLQIISKKKPYLLLDNRKSNYICPDKPIFEIVNIQKGIIYEPIVDRNDNYNIILTGYLKNGYKVMEKKIIPLEFTSNEIKFNLSITNNLVEEISEKKKYIPCSLSSGTFFLEKETTKIKCMGNKLEQNNLENIDITINWASKENKYLNDIVIKWPKDLSIHSKQLYSYNINVLSIQKTDHDCFEDKYYFYVGILDLKAEPEISFEFKMLSPYLVTSVCKLYTSKLLKCYLDLRLKKIKKGSKIQLPTPGNYNISTLEGNFINFTILNFTDDNQTGFADEGIIAEETCGNNMFVGAIQDIGYGYGSSIAIIVSIMAIFFIVFLAIGYCVIYEITHRGKKGKYYSHTEEKDKKDMSTSSNPIATGPPNIIPK